MSHFALAHSSSVVEVLALSPRQWRVSDPSKVERDGNALVGFVEFVAGRYEVTTLERPKDRSYFNEFSDAIRALEGECIARMESEGVLVLSASQHRLVDVPEPIINKSIGR